MCQHHSQYPLRSTTVNHPTPQRITDTRLDKFFYSPYASQHLDKLLDRARYSSSEYVKITHWAAPGDTKPGFDEAVARLEAEGRPIELGFMFGPSWSNHWTKVEISIPQEIRSIGQEVLFEFDPSCEALIFAEDGTPLHGITGGPNTIKDGRPGEQEDRRIEHIIPADRVRAGLYTIIIETSCNLMFGLGVFRYEAPPPDRIFPLVAADIVVPNYVARGLRNDFRLLTEIARHPDAKTFGLSKKAYKACDDIMNRFRRSASDEANNFAGVDSMLQACRDIGWEVIGSLDEKSLQQLAVNNVDEIEAKVWAIGHCHIDTAWLWRYTQTQQKIARSWTTQCDLMDRWENHQFCASSAQQYLWLEQLYPKGFERVKSYIDKGRFHYVGGAWLEHDCMLPSGESLVRQYLYGQRYFRSRFGHYCREAWLPDTFGYASQLPQILRQAGLEYFFTQKISWNNINTFPYNTFNWAGIDGTQVLAHMTPVDQYNGQCSFEEIVKAVRNNKNIEDNDQALFLFGNGDGGGGPTPLMMEKLTRLSALSRVEPSIPAIKMGGPAAFFDHLMESTQHGKKLPTWRGELYLEFHRGTYTTQTKIKAGNRDMETLLRDLEYFATIASLKDRDYNYPQAELDEMWQDVMLGQFHDCLPGTTINSVVLDNLNIYEKRSKQGHALLEKALAVLTTGTSQAITVIDPMRLQREEVVQREGKLAYLVTDGHGIGSFVTPPELNRPTAQKKGDSYVLSNGRFELVVSRGRITSLRDLLVERELIAPGPGCDDGGLMIYEDIPLTYDAWDVEIYHLKCGSTIDFDSVGVHEEPLRASLICSATFGDSSAVVTISLDALNADSEIAPLIRVNTKIDWHEKHKMLRFALPLDILSPNANYATQFGVIERPTHRNTTWDQAKFEACAHGFVDLSEANYGVAMVCRDKYGYAVEANTMRLSLVRGPTSPDPETDQGRHDIDFAIIPHQGQLGQSNVHIEAMRFNNRVTYVPGQVTTNLPDIAITGPHSKGIVLETIKRGEDDSLKGEKTVVLRMHEVTGGRASGELTLGFKVLKAEWVNILEEPLRGEDSHCVYRSSDAGPTPPQQTAVPLTLRPFEIRTLKVHVA